MSSTIASLQRKIGSAGDLHAVVRAMKAMAASNITQYERAVSALSDYCRTVELGLSVCFPIGALGAPKSDAKPGGDARSVDAIVFGSDQGLVGHFNEVVGDYAAKTLDAMHGASRVWAVGERIHASLVDGGVKTAGTFAVPNSVNAITSLVGQLLLALERGGGDLGASALYLIYNRPSSGATYAPVTLRLLPLDDDWRRRMATLPWPTKILPEVLGDVVETGRGFVREYIFISLFRACSESLASENASRLAAMQRADKNIKELLASLSGTFRSARQNGIDEELFDVVAGFEALSGERQ